MSTEYNLCNLSFFKSYEKLVFDDKDFTRINNLVVFGQFYANPIWSSDLIIFIERQSTI